MHDRRDHEDDRAEDADGRELLAGRDAAELGVGLLAEQRQRGDGGQQEGALGRQQQCQRSDGHQEHTAKTARDAAARMYQQSYGYEIDRELKIRLGSRAGRSALQQYEEYATSRKQGDQRAPSQGVVGSAHDARSVDEVEHRQQQSADGEAKKIEKNEDSPGEVRRHRTGCRTLRGVGALRVDGIDGRHGAEFYPIGDAASRCVLCGAQEFRGEYRRPPVAEIPC